MLSRLSICKGFAPKCRSRRTVCQRLPVFFLLPNEVDRFGTNHKTTPWPRLHRSCHCKWRVAAGTCLPQPWPSAGWTASPGPSCTFPCFLASASFPPSHLVRAALQRFVLFQHLAVPATMMEHMVRRRRSSGGAKPSLSQDGSRISQLGPCRV